MDLFSKNGLLVFGLFFIATLAVMFVMTDMYAEQKVTALATGEGFSSELPPKLITEPAPPSLNCPGGVIYNYCGIADLCNAYTQEYGDMIEPRISCEGGNLVETSYPTYECNFIEHLQTEGGYRCEKLCSPKLEEEIVEMCEGGCAWDEIGDGEWEISCADYGPCYGTFDGENGMSNLEKAQYLSWITAQIMPPYECAVFGATMESFYHVLDKDAVPIVDEVIPEVDEALKLLEYSCDGALECTSSCEEMPNSLPQEVTDFINSCG